MIKPCQTLNDEYIQQRVLIVSPASLRLIYE